MEYRANYIKNLEQGEVLANLGPIQQISEYANCWIVTVKTQDDLIMALKYPKSKMLITEHQ